MPVCDELDGMSDNLSDDDDSRPASEALHRFTGAIHDLVPAAKFKVLMEGLKLCQKQAKTASTEEQYEKWAQDLDKISKRL
jgi:hypothetical protein